MAVKERSSLDSLRERFAELLRAFADFLSPDRDQASVLLDRAPADDEPVTANDEAALEEAWREHERGEARPLDEVKRELG